jgi:hypothetical protein
MGRSRVPFLEDLHSCSHSHSFMVLFRTYLCRVREGVGKGGTVAMGCFADMNFEARS